MYEAITFLEQLLGSVMGGLGLLVLGFGMGWLTVHLLEEGDPSWVKKTIVFGIFVLSMVALIWMLPPGISGVYALGAGAGLLVFGAWRKLFTGSGTSDKAK